MSRYRIPYIPRPKMGLGMSVSVPASPATGVRKPLVQRPVSALDSARMSHHMYDKSSLGKQYIIFYSVLSYCFLKSSTK